MAACGIGLLFLYTPDTLHAAPSTALPNADTTEARAATGALQPERLRVEYATNPLGIDEKKPRLSWIVTSNRRGARQSAYRILVASSRRQLEEDRGDVWDTGKVSSDETVHIEYDGATLQSGQRYFWKVRVWDGEGVPSAWSAPALWSMGLLSPEDWQATWIGPSAEDLAPSDSGAALLMRQEVEVAQPVERATAYVSGLGYYELTIDGQKTGDRVLDPGFTDYSDRVLYATYDVTAALSEGRHVIGVTLAGGFYHLTVSDLFGTEKAPWNDEPKLLLQIDVEYADGTRDTFASGTGWQWAVGEVVFADIRGGETHDARRARPGWNTVGYDASAWTPVVQRQAPEGVLQAQAHPPIRITERVEPVSITEARPDVYVVDFGKNLTGWAELEASGSPGQRITLYHNEVLRPDGTLDTTHSAGHTWGGRFQKGELILSGSGTDRLTPRFTYHGFRYVEIHGLNAPPEASDLVAVAVHNDLETAGRFRSSHPRLNDLQQAVRRTLLNSVHGMPGEEPTREKMGWSYDALVLQEAYQYNFDAASTYTKYLHDLIDAQDPNGHMPPIAPTPGIWRTGPAGEHGDYADPWWGATIAYIPHRLYEFYGDRRIIERAYPHVVEYLDYLRSRAVSEPGAEPGSGLLLDWRLGDWLDRTWGKRGSPGLTPVIQSSTAAFYAVARVAAEQAHLLEKPRQARAHAALADSIRSVFNYRFYDPETATYQDRSQSAQAVPLWLGMVPEGDSSAVLDRLVDHVVSWDTTATAGFVGAFPMMEELADRGQEDLAFAMLMNEDGPGWLHFVEDSTSTLGENINPDGYGTSHHPYTAFIGFWFYHALAGIQPVVDPPGFNHTIIRPAAVDGLEWVEAAYDSIHGRVESAWRRQDGTLELRVVVPANTTATVYVPAPRPDTVREGGGPARDAEGVEFVRAERGQAIFRIGSGTYVFRTPM